MTIDRLKRVIWRLQEIKTIVPGVYSNKEIRLAIMEECGTDERTISHAIKKLTELKMLERAGFGLMKISMPVL